MAIFGKDKKKTDEEKDISKEITSSPAKSSIPQPRKAPGQVILRPKITEKATMMAERNVYAFEVTVDSTKSEIKKSIKALYNVMPEKIRIVRHKPEKFISRMRNRRGMRSGYKKAYVYLKEGDRIQIV